LLCLFSCGPRLVLLVGLVHLVELVQLAELVELVELVQLAQLVQLALLLALVLVLALVRLDRPLRAQLVEVAFRHCGQSLGQGKH
jgi:hypothetical protein